LYLSSQLQWEAQNRRISIHTQSQQKERTYLQKNQRKNGWRSSSSSRALSYQVWSSEFKLQYNNNNKNKQTNKKTAQCMTGFELWRYQKEGHISFSLEVSPFFFIFTHSITYKHVMKPNFCQAVLRARNIRMEWFFPP
jgi:hypothetical protein